MGRCRFEIKCRRLYGRLRSARRPPLARESRVPLEGFCGQTLQCLLRVHVLRDQIKLSRWTPVGVTFTTAGGAALAKPFLHPLKFDSCIHRPSPAFSLAVAVYAPANIVRVPRRRRHDQVSLSNRGFDEHFAASFLLAVCPVVENAPHMIGARREAGDRGVDLATWRYRMILHHAPCDCLL